MVHSNSKGFASPFSSDSSNVSGVNISGPPKEKQEYQFAKQNWLIQRTYGKTHQDNTLFGLCFSIFLAIPKNSLLKEFVGQLPPEPKIVAPLVCLTRHRGTSAKMPSPSNGWFLWWFSTGEVIKHVSPKVLLSSTFHQKRDRCYQHLCISFCHIFHLKKLYVFHGPSRETKWEKHTHRRSAPSKRSSVCAPWRALGPEINKSKASAVAILGAHFTSSETYLFLGHL